MNILAIDLGSKKTGLAIYREGFVLGGGVVPGWEMWDDLIRQIRHKVREQSINMIVIGLPKSTSGDAEKVYRQIGEKVAKNTGIEVDYIDETLTSAAAQTANANIDKSRKEDDEQAAKIILQDYVAQKNISS
jgi:putative transcription antitermination factor YqgF